MIITLITAIILFIFGILTFYFNRNSNKVWPDYLAIFFTLTSVILSWVTIYLAIWGKDIETNEPTALDVYRGKTTLQITYQDSIPVDSVVVFKNE